MKNCPATMKINYSRGPSEWEQYSQGLNSRPSRDKKNECNERVLVMQNIENSTTARQFSWKQNRSRLNKKFISKGVLVYCGKSREAWGVVEWFIWRARPESNSAPGCRQPRTRQQSASWLYSYVATMYSKKRWVQNRGWVRFERLNPNFWLIRLDII